MKTEPPSGLTFTQDSALFRTEVPIEFIKHDPIKFTAHYGLMPMDIMKSEFDLKIFTKRKVWRFPIEKFCTYEPSDEAWCRPLGIGEEIEIEEVTVFPDITVDSIDDLGVHFKVPKQIPEEK